MKKFILLFISIAFFAIIQAQESDNTFNRSRGPIVGAQLWLYPGYAPAPAINVAYKNERWIYFFEVGRAIDRFSENDITSDVELDFALYNIKLGAKVYPYKNVKKFRVYYQSFLSHRWYQDEEIKFYLFNIGSGVEYAINNKLTIGVGAYLGIGKEDSKSRYKGYYEGIVYDAGLDFSISYTFHSMK